jgi:hypothetical protein
MFVGTTDGYFSPDGGVTNLNNFNTDSDDDFGDWAASAGNDSFLAFSSSGVLNAVTATDVVVMDVIGWNAAPGSGGLVALLGHGGGGGAVRAGDGAPPPAPVTTHQSISNGIGAHLGIDPSFIVTGHVEAIGHSTGPIGTLGFGGTDWHLV